MNDIAESSEMTHAEYKNYCRMFRTFDHDNSGKIDEDELMDVVRMMGYAPVTKEMIESAIAPYGCEGLTLQQFVLVMNEMKSKYHIDTHNAELARKHMEKVTETDRLLSDDPWRWALDLVVFVIISYYTIVVPWRDVRPHSVTGSGVEGWEWFCTFIFSLDTVLNFFTLSKSADGEDHTTMKQISMHYLQGWFTVDFLSAFPFDMIAYYASSSRDSYIALQHLRLLRVFTLLGMFQLSSRRRFNPTYIYIEARIVPVARLVFYLIVVIHIYTVIWLSLSPDSTYVEAIYLVLYTITTVGLGDIPVVGTAQRIFNCVLFVSGAVVNGFVISKLSQILQKASVQQEKDEKMTEMVSLLRYFNIPRPLQEEILAFQYHQLENDVSTAFKECIEALPPTLQDQLSMYAKLEYVSKLPMCKEAHLECRMALARSMTQAVFSPQEFILCAGEKGTEMYFLTHGFADVLSPEGKFILTLKRGSFFGEYALLDDRPRSASVKALSYCDTLTLDRDSFIAILNRYPVFRQTVETLMKSKHVAVNSKAPPPMNESVLRPKWIFGQEEDNSQGDAVNPQTGLSPPTSFRSLSGPTDPPPFLVKKASTTDTSTSILKHTGSGSSGTRGSGTFEEDTKGHTNVSPQVSVVIPCDAKMGGELVESPPVGDKSPPPPVHLVAVLNSNEKRRKSSNMRKIGFSLETSFPPAGMRNVGPRRSSRKKSVFDDFCGNDNNPVMYNFTSNSMVNPHYQADLSDIQRRVESMSKGMVSLRRETVTELAAIRAILFENHHASNNNNSKDRSPSPHNSQSLGPVMKSAQRSVAGESTSANSSQPHLFPSVANPSSGSTSHSSGPSSKELLFQNNSPKVSSHSMKKGEDEVVVVSDM